MGGSRRQSEAAMAASEKAEEIERRTSMMLDMFHMVQDRTAMVNEIGNDTTTSNIDEEEMNRSTKYSTREISIEPTPEELREQAQEAVAQAEVNRELDRMKAAKKNKKEKRASIVANKNGKKKADYNAIVKDHQASLESRLNKVKQMNNDLPEEATAQEAVMQFLEDLSEHSAAVNMNDISEHSKETSCIALESLLERMEALEKDLTRERRQREEQFQVSEAQKFQLELQLQEEQMQRQTLEQRLEERLEDFIEQEEESKEAVEKRLETQQKCLEEQQVALGREQIHREELEETFLNAQIINQQQRGEAKDMQEEAWEEKVNSEQTKALEERQTKLEEELKEALTKQTKHHEETAKTLEELTQQEESPSRDDIKALEEKHTKLEKELKEALDKQNNQHEETITTLQKRVEVLEGQHLQQQEEQAQLKEELQQLKQELAQHKEESKQSIDNLTQDKDNLKAGLNDNRVELGQLQSHKVQLQASLKEEQTKRQEQQAAMDKMRAALEGQLSEGFTSVIEFLKVELTKSNKKGKPRKEPIRAGSGQTAETLESSADDEIMNKEIIKEEEKSQNETSSICFPCGNEDELSVFHILHGCDPTRCKHPIGLGPIVEDPIPRPRRTSTKPKRPSMIQRLSLRRTSATSSNSQPTPAGRGRRRASTSSSMQDSGHWMSFVAEDGQIYYHNGVTGESQWELPGLQQAQASN